MLAASTDRCDTFIRLHYYYSVWFDLVQFNTNVILISFRTKPMIRIIKMKNKIDCNNKPRTTTIAKHNKNLLYIYSNIVSYQLLLTDKIICMYVCRKAITRAEQY